MKPVVLLALLLIPAVLPADPPVLNSLYPAGASCGKSAEVTVSGTFSRWPIQTWCSDSGVSLTPLATRGTFSVKVAADALPGVVWVRLHNEEGASAVRPFLIGVLPEVNEQEPNDDVKTATKAAVAAGVVVNGRLEKPGDVDCFAVSLRKGQTLVAEVLANETLGSPMDGVLQVVSTDGFVLAENNDDRGLDPRIVFTALADGTFIVRLFAFPALANSSIRFAGAETYIYRLTLTAGPFADHAFPLAVARTNPGEVDVIGWNLPQLARFKPTPVNEDEQTLFDPRFVRPVRVRLESHPCVVEKEPTDRSTPQALTLPITVSGRIEPPGDIDVYRFNVKKGQPLLVQLESKTLGFPLEGALRLTDASGKMLLEQQAAAGRDPSLSYTPPADAELRIEVRDLYRHGGSRHVYRLRIAPPEPALALTLKADRFIIAAGKTLDLPVTIEARNGFKEELDIAAEGLPEGVSAVPLKWTPAKGASVVLKVTAAKGPLSGAFSVVGKGSRKTTAMASGTSHLWLTVTP